MTCNDEISDLMLINLIAQGFKPEIAEKVIDRDPVNFEDLCRFARRAESTIKFRKSDPVIASIEETWKTGLLIDYLSNQKPKLKIYDFPMEDQNFLWQGGICNR